MVVARTLREAPVRPSKRRTKVYVRRDRIRRSRLFKLRIHYIQKARIECTVEKSLCLNDTHSSTICKTLITTFNFDLYKYVLRTARL